jgi:hypothetical protein
MTALKRDAADILREQGADGFREQIDRELGAKRVEPPQGNGRDEPSIGELGEWDAGDDPGPIPPRQWLLGNQFCRGYISSLVSAGGIGKSALRLLQFISLALGRPLSGQHIFHRSRVLLISLEDDDNELQRRIKAVLDYFGIPRSELKGWLFCKYVKRCKIAELKDGHRVAGPLDQQIRDAIARRKPDLVALDPFVKLHSLGESDSGDMNFVCDVLVSLAVENQIAVDIPHHVHKGQIAPGDADAGRGSSGIRDAGRLIFTLTPMSEADAKQYDVDMEDRHSFIRLDSAKLNIASRSGRATWFRIVSQSIDNSTDAYPSGDSVQVVTPWAPPALWGDLDNALLNKILDALEAGRKDENGRLTGELFSDAPSAKGGAAWRIVELFAPDKSEQQCRAIIREWLRTGVLEHKQYRDEKARKDRTGLRVNFTMRPGYKISEERL